jgi:hypothetical protein
MALDSLLRKGVALANRVTASLQVEVSHSAWIGSDSYDKPAFALPVPYDAIVERGKKAVRTTTGEEIVPRYVITFLRPIERNGTAGRDEPIDPRDLLTLPDGTSGKILQLPDGVLDPATNAPYATVVALGPEAVNG